MSASQTCSSTSRSIRFGTNSFSLLKIKLPSVKIIFFSFFKALQKDVLTNASALNEVISSSKKYLEENRNKMTPDQIAIIESKLEEAKSKASLINQQAEESKKDLEKIVTTTIKQESEKVLITFTCKKYVKHLKVILFGTVNH